MPKMDAFAFSDLRAPFLSSVLEAMAAGLPAIVPDVPVRYSEVRFRGRFLAGRRVPTFMVLAAAGGVLRA